MRYLRTLSNSLVAATLGTAYVLALILQMNPSVPLDRASLMPLAGALALFYTVHLTAIAYALLVVVQLLAAEPFSPAWMSVNVLAWLGAGLAGAAAALMWANVHRFALVLDPPVVRRMFAGAVALACASALFIIVGLARRRAGAKRFVLGLAWSVVAAGSVAAPLALRGRAMRSPLESRSLAVPVEAEPVESAARITIIAVDAASLDFIADAAAEGRLPNFGRILDAGAVMHLATIHPTSPETVWSAVATGKLPQKNGIRGAASYPVSGGGGVQLLPEFCFATHLLRSGFITEEPLGSAAFRARPLWSILSLRGASVGVVNWPLTYPAAQVRGYMVSDVYARAALTLQGVDDPQLLYPQELRGDARELVAQADADPAPVLPAGIDAVLDERRRAPARDDRINDRLAAMLWSSRSPQVSILRYASLDPIGHYFLRYAMPSAFGDVSDEERRALGPVLGAHYSLIDEAIGRAIASLRADDLLLVVSGYGMQPIGLARRAFERVFGDPDVSGAHDDAPDGFLMAYGAPVARARSLRRASVVDVVPTILYFLGLPIGRDMDGFARTDIFQPSFTADRPLTFIPTYEH